MCIPTPHNAAKKGDIAKKVLMPGESPACEIYCRQLSGESGVF